MDELTIKKILLSQYQATLKMLLNVIDKCPDGLWADTSYQSPFWQIVYHSIHFTAFYLSEDEASFTPWANHRLGIHQLGNLGNQGLNVVIEHYSKSDLQGYVTQIVVSLENKIHEQTLTDPSGFEWLSMNKLELHFYNLRHLQHHIGQLIERLHQAGIKGIAWIGSVH